MSLHKKILVSAHNPTQWNIELSESTINSLSELRNHIKSYISKEYKKTFEENGYSINVLFSNYENTHKDNELIVFITILNKDGVSVDLDNFVLTNSESKGQSLKNNVHHEDEKLGLMEKILKENNISYEIAMVPRIIIRTTYEDDINNDEMKKVLDLLEDTRLTEDGRKCPFVHNTNYISKSKALAIFGSTVL